MTNLVATPKMLPDYAKNTERDYVGDPWSRQPHETKEAHEAFKLYVSLDPATRTVAEADRIRRANKGLKEAKPRVAYEWSSKHRWLDRAEAHDNYVLQKEIAAQRRARVRRVGEQAKDEQLVQEVLMAPMRELRKRLEENLDADGKNIIQSMDDADLTRLAKVFSDALPAHQKSEREALTSTKDIAPPTAKAVRTTGKLVRQIIANPTLFELMEQITFQIDEEIVDGEIVDEAS